MPVCRMRMTHDNFRQLSGWLSSVVILFRMWGVASFSPFVRSPIVTNIHGFSMNFTRWFGKMKSIKNASIFNWMRTLWEIQYQFQSTPWRIPHWEIILLFVNHSQFCCRYCSDWIHSQIGNTLICRIPNWCFVNLDESLFVWKSPHNNHSLCVLFVMRTIWQPRSSCQTIDISFRSYTLFWDVAKSITCRSQTKKP